MCWTVSWKEKCLCPEICIKRYTTARQPPISLLDVITAILFDSVVMQPLLTLFRFSLSFSLSSFPHSPHSRVCVVVGVRKDTRWKLGGREILRAHWQLCLRRIVSQLASINVVGHQYTKTDQTHRFRRPGGKRHNTQCPINSLRGSEKVPLPGLGSRISDTSTARKSRVPVPVPVLCKLSLMIRYQHPAKHHTRADLVLVISAHAMSWTTVGGGCGLLMGDASSLLEYSSM